MNIKRVADKKGGIMFLSLPITAKEKIVIPQGAVDEFWYDTIRYGETHAHISLPPMLEKYLVMTLMEYLHETHLMDTPIAIHLLEGVEQNNLIRLSRAASVSLLILGLFPERMDRMLISSSYLLFIGQTSYDHLALHFEAIRRRGEADLARQARDSFEPMARVLRGMRMTENMFTLPVSV